MTCVSPAVIDVKLDDRSIAYYQGKLQQFYKHKKARLEYIASEK